VLRCLRCVTESIPDHLAFNMREAETRPRVRADTSAVILAQKAITNQILGNGLIVMEN
jgi:hypothetical protein